MIEEHGVLIVGAGLAGLSAAMFLGVHGVPALVVERHPGTSIYPKARGQSPNTLEALRVAGVAERFEAADTGAPFRIAVAASMTGPVYRDILATVPDLSAVTPEGSAGLSQERAETLLLDRARELGAEVRFATLVESFDQDESGVTATLRDVASGEVREVRTCYLVAADGHRSPIRGALGIGTHGHGGLGSGTGVLFEASDVPQQGLFYLRNPELPGGSGVLVSTDLPERFAFGIGLSDDLDPDGFTEQRWVELIRIATGVPDLEPKLLPGQPGRSETAHRIADRFSAGRVHLIGDAARVMPPTGGGGGNAALLDGYHLAWKLAFVLRGFAGPGLLDSHDPERRAYSEFVAGQQYREFVLRLGSGVDEDLPEQVESVATLFFGHRNLSGAIVPDPDEDGAGLENPEHPTGRPGSRAAYVRLRDGDRELSTISLFGRRFVLLGGAEGQPWITAAHEAAATLGIELDTYLIGQGGLADPEDRFERCYRTGTAGAVLVRPDGVIAWRSPGDIEDALRTILDLR
jgi:2-polyprenyl-6-methoxyphenol hydroxylase-like FAD-dependent oxidoreductase